MATSKLEKRNIEHRNTLQGILLTAVYCKYDTAIRRALEVIREQKLDEFKRAGERQKDGKQLLNFLPDQKKQQVPPEYCSHSPLMLACEMEDVDRVKLLLEEGASAAFKNKESLNALHIACNLGNLDICHLIVESARKQNYFGKKHKHGSDLHILVNAKEKRGWTPLMYAVKKNKKKDKKNDMVDIVNMLMSTEVIDISTTNKKGATFLHIACSEGSVKTLQHFIRDGSLLPKELLMATDKKGWNIIHYACCSDAQFNSHCSAQWLLENIPLTDTEKSELVTQKTERGYSPLLTACEYKKLEAVKFLTSREDVDVSDFVEEKSAEEDGRTGEKSALHLSAIHDSVEIAKVLLDKGCRIDRVDLKGDTVLHITRAKCSQRVERLLLKSPCVEKILTKRNQDGKVPSEVKPEDVIPPEVMKRGKEFVERYREALRKGKQKIPRCGLLFLGEARKGKTSLYKLMVGKEFDPNQESTRGIDNNEVDTVDTRTVTMNWSEKSEEEQHKERHQSHALGLLRELPDLEKQPNITLKFQIKSEHELLQRINMIEARINKERAPQVKFPPTISLGVTQPHNPSFNVSQEPFSPVISQMTDLKLDKDTTSPRSNVAAVTEPSVETRKPKASVVAAPPLSLKTQQHTAPAAAVPTKTSSAPLPDIPKAPVVSPLIERSSSVSTGLEVRNFREVRKLPKKHEPTLLLNVLDFAGQKNYRPMHHCFIRRRSMYILVFNLQDMLRYLKDCNSPPNPIEELRYWLHSIHAHIYPPEPKEKEKDECQQRVVLVGTHRNPGQTGQEVTKGAIQKINDVLRDELVQDDRCVDHIFEVSEQLFIPVENSIGDPEESGARCLRETLHGIKNQMKFLEEMYPLPWLRFEGRLIEMKERFNMSKCVTNTEIISIAEECGILYPQDAMAFFHDIGEIIVLGRVSKLFLNEEAVEKISELVIVDPKWLIKVMQTIMELRSENLRGRDRRNLREQGEISLDVLRRLWSDREQAIPESKLVDAEKLSIILQAYCLIHPVLSSEAESDAASPHYIIPSMLPCLDNLKKDIGECTLPWMEFYFNFDKFLPIEVYHRLVCMFISEAHGYSKKRDYQLSDRTCCFQKVQNCKWKLELEATEHRIKICVIISGKKLKPSKCIHLVHERYLKKICKESGLQGLRYHGGPMLPCNCLKTGGVSLEQESRRDKACSVYTLVSFDVDGGEEEDLVLECPKCMTEFSDASTADDEVDKILLKQYNEKRHNSLSATKSAAVLGTPLSPPEPGELTIEKLKVCTGVTDSQLNTEIKETDIRKISEHFKNVEEFIPFLGLKPGQQTDIKDLASQRGTNVAICEAIRLWKKGIPLDATFRSLLNILLEIEQGNVAMKVCKMLCNSVTDKSGMANSSSTQ